MKMKKLLYLFIYLIFLIYAGCGENENPFSPLAPQNPAPVASFSISGSTVTPATLTLNNTSQNADSYQWNFGDGRSSNIHSPTVTYTTRGQYTITLTATQTSTGRTSTTSQTVSITPGNVYLRQITINQIPFNDSQGAGWDLTTGPDVYIDVVSGGTIVVSSSVVYDVTQSQLPIQYTLSNPYQISNWSQQYRIDIWDYDDLSNDDYIGSVNFTINGINQANNYPTTSTIQNGQVRVTLTLDWR